MKIESISQKFDTPLKAVVTVLGVTALVLGILSLLYQYDVVLALKGLGSPLGFTGAWVMTVGGAALALSPLAFYREAPKEVARKAVKPTIASTIAPSIKPVSYHMAPLKRDGLGRIAWAKNFCYASSIFFALFGSGDHYKEDLLNTLKSDLKPEVRAFLEHLLFKVLNPMRSGLDVPLKTMQECQKLVWEAGWKNQRLERFDAGADSDVFRQFLLSLIGKKVLLAEMQGKTTSEPLWDHTGDVKDSQGQFILNLEDSLKGLVVRNLGFLKPLKPKVHDRPLEGSIVFPPLTTIQLSRAHPSGRFEYSMPFKSEMSSYDVIPEKFRPPKPQILRLVSIVLHTPARQHLWSYVRMQNDTWLHCDDKDFICRKVPFEEVQEVARLDGLLFNYEIL